MHLTAFCFSARLGQTVCSDYSPSHPAAQERRISAPGKEELTMSSQHDNCPCMETCPLNRALTLIGGKWKMQILCSLHNNGPTRYNQLKPSLDGVSNTVLRPHQRPAGAGSRWSGGPAGVSGGPGTGGVRRHPPQPAPHSHFRRPGRVEYGALSHQNGRPRCRFRRCSSPAPGALFTPLK